MGKPRQCARTVAIVFCLAILIGGCIPFPNPTDAVVGPNEETITPTPNATLRAIAIMLTETRAAPTATPRWSPPLKLLRKLPSFPR
jgi:hypothetical protein